MTAPRSLQLNIGTQRSDLETVPSSAEDDEKRVGNSQATLKTTPMTPEQELARCPDVLKSRGFDIQELIGAGGFSTVYQAEGPDKPGGKKVKMACKVIKFANVPKAWKISALNNELKISRHLRHPHVVTVYHITKTFHNAYIFMELAQDTISSYMKKKPKEHNLSEARTQFWFREAMTAMEYMCLRGVAHRDLKTDNLLLVAQTSGGSPHVKVADFSFACYVKDKVTRKIKLSTTPCGTKQYEAPEILQGVPYDPRFSDMWSAGIILYEMLTDKFPFPFNDVRMTDKDFIELVKTKAWKFPNVLESKLSVEVKDLTFRLLEFSPKKRYDASQCLAHPFLKLPEAK